MQRDYFSQRLSGDGGTSLKIVIYPGEFKDIMAFVAMTIATCFWCGIH